MRRNRRVPAQKQERKISRVFVDFVMGTDGRVCEAQIQQSVIAHYDQEAPRLVRATCPAGCPPGPARAKPWPRANSSCWSCRVQ